MYNSAMISKFNTDVHATVDPVRESDPMFGRGETRERHPAYAMIGASRVTGGKVLFGSDFVHQNYIVVRIHAASVRRGLSNDWESTEGRLPYIEVALSESQWAGFVSRMNVGDGVPCTALFTQEQGYIPQIPEPPNRTKQFGNEMNELAKNGKDALKTLRAKINEMKISEKQRKELLWQAELAERAIGGSAEFIQEQFGEHMEKTKDAAKTEVYAFIESHIKRSGLEALGVTSQDVLQLGNDDRTIDAE